MSAERAPRKPGSRRVPLTSARSIGWLSIAVVSAISLLRLAGGLLHLTVLTSVAPAWTEMKMITLVCFLFSAGALILIYLRPANSRRSIGAMLLGGIVALIGLATIADYVSDLVVGRASVVTQAPFLNLFFATHARMAMITAAVFTLVGFTVVLLAMGGRRAAHVAHALAFPAATASYIVPLSYLLGVQSMSAVLGTPMALNTGLAFCFLCLGVFCTRTDTWLMKALTGDEIGAYMARRLLPALMATPLVIGWLRLQGERTGLFSSEVGVALVAATYTVVFVVLVWLAARAANRTDALRRVAERAVRENEERFALAFAGNPAAIALTRLEDGVFLDVNDTWVALTEYSREEAIGHSARQMRIWPSAESASRFVEELKAKGVLRGWEQEFLKKSGAAYVAELSAQTLTMRGEKVILSTLVDITARKRAAEALRESESKFRIVADNTYDFEFWLDPEGRYIYASPSCERTTGYKPNEFIADPELRFRIAHPEDRQMLMDHARSAEHEKPGVLDHRIIHRDGSVRWIGHVCQPVFDSTGGFLGTRGSNRDITRRKVNEARVARLVKLYAVLSRVNETIVRTRDAGVLYSEVCRIVSEEGAFPLVWVGLVDGKQVKPVACCGTACDYLKEVSVETEGEMGNGPTGVSIREDRAVVNDDFTANPATSPWRQPALRYGFRSSASFPLHRKGKVVGAFTLYASEPGEFDAEQVRLFEALSADVSYALDAIDQERLRTEAEAALREAKETLEVRVEERTAELTAEIDERKRAEERLTALSQYARSLLESSLDPLVTINAEGRITDVNEATTKVTGASRVELIGTDFCEYFNEPEKAREGYRRAFAEGFVTDYPLTIRHRDGHVTDVLYNASVYRDAKGSVNGVFAAARDVTVQKQASQYARSLIEASLDPLVTISAEGKITDVNEATIKVTGCTREQLIGTDFSDYFTEPEKAREGYRQVFAKGLVTDYPLTIRRRDGHLTDVLYNAAVYRDTRGNTIGVFAAARDVTDRKRAEEALHKAYDTLEDKVEERTAELKRSNEELEQFAYVASHDLQEPLRMVASYVQLLGQRYKGRLDEKADRYIAYASDGAVRMHQLVNDLLSLSRVGTRGTPLAPVSLDRIVAQARDNLATAIYQSGAEVEVGPMPTVLGDEAQLIQLFQNLVDNAIKFHGPESPLVRISADSLVPSVSFVTIRVSDNGIGIDPKHADRIFGLFKRLHTEQEYPGTGIGLAVCKKIVERHGGTIHVESEPGEGSTFIFTLPKKEEAEAKVEVKPEESGTKNQEPTTKE